MTPHGPLAILAEASFTPLEAKTAVGVLRYRAAGVAAVIDSTRAGRTATECVGTGGGVPVVADVAAAADAGARAMLIGIAPAGGRLPAAWRAAVVEALGRGWDVLSGLHSFLGDDADLARRARDGGARLVDLRRPPADLSVGLGRAAHCGVPVVLTVGTDCNVGKMTAALELQQALRAEGVNAAFVATGQTGMVIADGGVAVDAVPSDFVAGAVESLVLAAARDADVVIVEGQGSLSHPAFSGVTLGLLHGSCPEAMILCHQAGRERLRIAARDVVPPAIAPLAEVRAAYEQAAAWVRPSRVVAAAINTLGLDEASALGVCAAAERELGMPATDPVRFGAANLARVMPRRRSAGGV
jgi:uncharacterized NAD-dependent epimerase/dehydratase family protein